jgi:hypothetical protein
MRDPTRRHSQNSLLLPLIHTIPFRPLLLFQQHTHIDRSIPDAPCHFSEDPFRPSTLPTSAPPSTARPQRVSPALAVPGSNVPAETAPGPAAAVEAPTPTAAMLASARPVPSATAGDFRVRNFRSRASGFRAGRLPEWPVSWPSSTASKSEAKMVA